MKPPLMAPKMIPTNSVATSRSALAKTIRWMAVAASGVASPARTPKVVRTKEASTGAQVETSRGSAWPGKD